MSWRLARRAYSRAASTRGCLCRRCPPQFLSHGDGCRVVDSEGRTWIDYLAGFGANVLGYNHRRVEAAASEAARRGATLTGPTELSVALAERLVSLRPAADWVLLANGSTWRLTPRPPRARRRDGAACCASARASAAARRRVLGVSRQLAGLDARPAGRARGGGRALGEAYEYNDLASVEAALAPRRRLRGDLPVGGASYPYSAPTREPTAEFARSVRALADAHGALLVLDEIRTNFRVGRGVAPGTGQSSARRAPLAPVAAPTLPPPRSRLTPSTACARRSRTAIRCRRSSAAIARAAAAASITWTGTFWLSPGPMAAALTTLDELAADDGAAMRHMRAMGAALAEGLRAQALDHRVRARVTGAAAMPLLTFDADAAPERARAMTFCAAAARRGVGCTHTTIGT